MKHDTQADINFCLYSCKRPICFHDEGKNSASSQCVWLDAEEIEYYTHTNLLKHKATTLKEGHVKPYRLRLQRAQINKESYQGWRTKKLVEIQSLL